MYEGSMVGAGCHVFAVWGYVISKGHYSSETVELNPKLLAFILGSKEEEITKAIEFLSSPDINSRTKEHEGRRLIKQGEFLYYVPNLKKYRDTFDEDCRREYMKEYMKEYRHGRRKTNVSTVKLKLATVKQVEGEGEVKGEEEVLCRAEEVLSYLNEKTGKKFQAVNGSLKFIEARLCDGATVEQCRAVIDLKCLSWLKDTKMKDYLRPQTLFNAEKFAAYIGEIGAQAPAQNLKDEWDNFGVKK